MRSSRSNSVSAHLNDRIKFHVYDAARNMSNVIETPSGRGALHWRVCNAARFWLRPCSARPARLTGRRQIRPRRHRAASRPQGRRPVLDRTSGHRHRGLSPRSAGGKHDFFSEGDYWWPDPTNPNGPYIQRDGMTNPDNFVEHRRAMIRLSLVVPALAAAYKLTQRSQVRRSRRPPPARLVRGRSHAHESQPALRAGHPGTLYRTRHRDHRHPAPGGSGARRLALDLTPADLDGCDRIGSPATWSG